jgi:serine/threonine protein kinase
MSTAQLMIDLRPSGNPRCSRCATELPAEALFCPACGERTLKGALQAPPEQGEIHPRYRKTSLLIRRPYVGLFLAVDSQRQRPVAIRDVDVSSLDEADQANAHEIIKREYDLLRRLALPASALTPAIDVMRSQEHLLTIMDDSSFPARIYTLQDVLQSGAGRPRIALALSLIEHLCATVAQLHRQHIVIGYLDPLTIMLNRLDYSGLPAIFLSWLPTALADLLPPTLPATFNASTSNCIAPEALLGKPDVRSDIYSLGALLYLLLTGQSPEAPGAYPQHRSRFPSELNPQISGRLDKVVMQALALEPEERFQSARALQEALAPFHSNGRKPIPGKNLSRSILMTREPHEEQASVASSPAEIACEHEPDLDGYNDDDSIPTIAMSFREAAPPVIVESEASDVPVSEFPADPAITPLPSSDEEEQAAVDDVTSESITTAAPVSEVEQTDVDGVGTTAHPLATIEMIEPVVPESALAPALIALSDEEEAIQISLPAEIPASRALVPYRPTSKLRRNTEALLERIRDTLLGEQRLEITAAAAIETPLRVQPDQAYTIRIQIMGRDAVYAHAGQVQNSSKSGKDRQASSGLSALAEGDKVLIEVRSAIYERYAYVVQKAEVTLPAAGYVAEVTIPLRPLSQGPSGRRDRLHIFFLDEERHPLYEKPFVVELFISHRVQPGHEGHNVLTIPV